jgi:hypothetical protein
MKRIKSKARRKARQEAKGKEAILTFLGEFAGIDFNKIVKTFPDKQERQEYINALCQEFA